MNASGMFTQCTHCKAYFRVRAVTLRVGQGIVFCTSCRNQFNGLERLQEGDPGFPILDAIPVTEPAARPSGAPAPTAEPAPAPSPAQPAAVTESAVAAGVILAPEAAVVPELAVAPEPAVVAESATTDAYAAAEADVEVGEEEEWRWDFEEVEEIGEAGEGEPAAEPLLADAQADVGAASGALPEADAPSVLARIPILEPDEAPLQAASARAEAPTPAEAPAPAGVGARADLAPAPDTEAAEPAAGAARDDAQPPEALWSDFAAPAPRPHPLATAGWSVGILLLLAALAGQFVYFQSANLAYYPALHPWLERFCTLTGCSVPLPRDLTRFEILDRRVYDDPSVPNALVISLILQNDAAFRQAYPYLQVRFFNLAGQVVALRRFPPRDYLPQGVDAAAGFQAHGSVPVTLQIADPGKAAVSYDFAFR